MIKKIQCVMLTCLYENDDPVQGGRQALLKYRPPSLFSPAFRASGFHFSHKNCRKNGRRLEIRVNNNKFRAPFDQKCPLVKNYHNMTRSMTLSTDTDGTTETDNTW